MQDIFDVLPYQSSLEVVTLKGKFLKEVFDYASSKYSRYFGGFLQVSGNQISIFLSTSRAQLHRCVLCIFIFAK